MRFKWSERNWLNGLKATRTVFEVVEVVRDFETKSVPRLFSRKLSELGSRLGFGVQGLGRGLGAAAGQKWSFRVRRMSISLYDGFPVLS